MLHGRNQHNIVKQLSSNLKKKKCKFKLKKQNWFSTKEKKRKKPHQARRKFVLINWEFLALDKTAFMNSKNALGLCYSPGLVTP